jgi:hypothetical protein
VCPEVLHYKRWHRDNFSSSPQYKQEYRHINAFAAARVLGARASLSLPETALLWGGMEWLFHVKKPLRKNWIRFKKHVLRIEP